jgi:hypothetical protein
MRDSVLDGVLNVRQKTHFILLTKVVLTNTLIVFEFQALYEFIAGIGFTKFISGLYQNFVLCVNNSLI